jgi:NAD(P)-dependent dehydrogenase (short-subunit alcohol dehydrogenase family)
MATSRVFVDGLLRGRVALVTGGGSGIGASIAELLAEHGAVVGLMGRTQEKLDQVKARIEKAGGSAHTLACDVRNAAQLEGVINDFAQRCGSLSIVINSAAGNFLAPAAGLSANGFRAVVDIDLCGTFNVSRFAFPHLSKQGGSIVSITATQALVPTPLQCHVGAAKAGIEKLTRDLALEWAPFGIRVNTVAPGPIEDTEGMSRLAPKEAGDLLRKRVPLQRWGTKDEIAQAVLFLVSPAGSFMTGSTLLMDGGTALLGPGPFLEMMQGSLT